MEYDKYRNLTGVQVGNQDLVSYTYKAGTNRLKTVAYENGSEQTLTYDRFGNVVTEVWMQGNIKQAEYRYSYDASRNLVKTVDILNRKMYNINRSGENIASVEEYHIGWNVLSPHPETGAEFLYYYENHKSRWTKEEIKGCFSMHKTVLYFLYVAIISFRSRRSSGEMVISLPASASSKTFFRRLISDSGKTVLGNTDGSTMVIPPCRPGCVVIG